MATNPCKVCLHPRFDKSKPCPGCVLTSHMKSGIEKSGAKIVRVPSDAIGFPWGDVMMMRGGFLIGECANNLNLRNVRLLITKSRIVAIHVHMLAERWFPKYVQGVIAEDDSIVNRDSENVYSDPEVYHLSKRMRRTHAGSERELRKTNSDPGILNRESDSTVAQRESADTECASDTEWETESESESGVKENCESEEIEIEMKSKLATWQAHQNHVNFVGDPTGMPEALASLGAAPAECTE